MDGKLSTYRTIDTLGKSQVDLILQVYDGAIASFKAAAGHYGAGELQGGYEQLERSRKFMVHLYTTLDQKTGGEVAANLSKLYTFMICQIDAAETTHDSALIESNVRVLENLRAAWVTLRDQNETARKLSTEPSAATAGSFTISG
jgi:flagellar protein FliS